MSDVEHRHLVYRAFGYRDLTSANELLLEAALLADQAMPVQHAQGSQYQQKRGGPGHDMRLFTIHQTNRSVSELWLDQEH